MAQVVTMRDAIATRINDLSQRWAENTIALGREFKRARDSFPVTGQNDQRSGLKEWIKTHTGFSYKHAISFIRIADKFEEHAVGVNLSYKVLEYLARDAVPDAAVKEVLGRAKGGEKIGAGAAKAIVEQHLPTRAQAIKQAADTGKLVTARDGKMYSGASEDEMAAYSDRRSVVFGIERAFNAIADCEWTPKEWIERAEDHWIGEMNLGKLDAAIKFLTKLQPLLAKRQKVIGQ